MRLLLIAIMSAVPLAAYADVIRLADGQVISGKIQSCQQGEIVVAPLAGTPVLLKLADVVSGEGAGIERCLGGRTGGTGTGRWYGWQILLAETASVIAIPIGVGISAPGLADVGLVGVFLSPAILHVVHGNPGRGAASIGIHVVLGLGGLLLGTAIGADNRNDDVPNFGGPIGLVLSQVVATTIDVASFAYEDPPPRVSMGVLFRETPYRRGQRAAPAGLSLALRF